MERNFKQKCQICCKTIVNGGVQQKILACAGCKAFYKRTALKKLSFKCYFGGECATNLDELKLSRCKACRYRKCTELGMRIRPKRIGEEKFDRSNTRAKSDARLPADRYHDTQVWTCPKIGLELVVNLVRVLEPEDVNLHETHLATDAAVSDRVDSECSSAISGVPDADDWLADHEIQSMVDLLVLDGDLSLDEVLEVSQSDSEPLETSTQSSLLPNFLFNARRLALDMTLDSSHRHFFLDDFGSYLVSGLDKNSTVYTITTAAKVIFGDQITSWTAYRDRALQYGDIVCQPETSLEQMVIAINQHNYDFLLRMLTFSAICPGMETLRPTMRDCSSLCWKFQAVWMIYHAPFMTDSETMYTVGPQNFRYCRYWQNFVSVWPLMGFIYKFCTAIRDIGLNDLEYYLLMGIVLLEPVDNDVLNNRIRMSTVHQHYMDVLLHVIKQRCHDATELRTICHKLERIFAMLKTSSNLCAQYYASLETSPLVTLAMYAKVMQLKEENRALEFSMEDLNEGYDNVEQTMRSLSPNIAF